MIQLAVIGSGNGSNFQSILDAIQAGHLSAQVKCVLSDCENAYILERARKAGLPALFVDCAPFKTKLDGEAEARVIQILREHDVDCVALAGFMRMVKAPLLNAFPHRIVNIHPALLPAFPGLRVWEKALTYGVKITGCTIHFVDEGMDTGPIILQRAVPVLDTDTPETLHARIQVEEHTAYPEALQLIAEGRIRIAGRRVLIDNPPSR